MFKKMLRWLLVFLGVVALLLGVAVAVLNNYLRNHQEELVAELLRPLGFSVAYHHAEITAWSTFPRISLAVDSLVLRDTTRAATETATLAVERLYGEVLLDAIWRDTIRLTRVELAGGKIYVASDSLGRFNLGRLSEPVDSSRQSAPKEGNFAPILDWNGAQTSLRDLQLSLLHPKRYKRMETYVDSLKATGARGADGRLQITSDLSMRVGTIAFNTRLGGYLNDTPVSGSVRLDFSPQAWHVRPTELNIDGQIFSAAADLSREEGQRNSIRLATKALDYERTRALLHDTLRSRLADYHADGTFPVSAEIGGTLAPGEEPEITIQFALSGQNVKLKQYHFTDVHTSGTLVNQLTPAERPHPNPRKNLRITIGQLSAYQGRTRLQAPWAITRIAGRDTRLEAPMRFSGPSAEVSRWFNARDFLLRRGRFLLEIEVDGSLLYLDELIAKTDGQLRLQEVDVRYAPAGISFPFSGINLSKIGDDIKYQLRSRPLPTGFLFDLHGEIDNLAPLLMDRPGEALRADATLESPRIDWADFRTYFGQDGYFATETIGENAGADDEPRAVDEDPQVTAMKQALLGLERTFHPQLEARFDTVTYYDVFTLHNFHTGLHFKKDTMVLEQTSFNWEDSDLSFRADVDLAGRAKTPFELGLQAHHLDLNHLRPTLDYFGLRLPTELDTLPRDLNVDFRHRGMMVDTGGLAPGSNAGEFIFNDGKDSIFSGTVQYTPKPAGLHTEVRLTGDPLVVNSLFSSENFLFGSGSFNIDLTVNGTPENLGELIDQGELHLRIDSSRIRYEPTKASIPVHHFSVDVVKGSADYWLQLLTEETNNTINLHGNLDSLSAFLYPQVGRSFRVQADASAQNLHWNDVRTFMGTEAVSVNDTNQLDVQHLLFTTSGAFQTFRPDLSLCIDTFQIPNASPLMDLHAGLYLRDSTALILEESGFTLGDGEVRFDATYALDQNQQSPFFLNWQVYDLALGRLMAGLDRLAIAMPDTLGVLRGKLSLSGSLAGWIDESAGSLLLDSTSGYVDYSLTDLALINWPALKQIGRKAMMKKRFQQLRFAPLSGHLKLTDNRLPIPRTEIQSTALQLFVEGYYDLRTGPDLLVSLPLRNIGRGLLEVPPDTTGYAHSGWKVYLATVKDKGGNPKLKFRLGKRKFFKKRGRLEEFRMLKAKWRAERKLSKEGLKKLN